MLRRLPLIDEVACIIVSLPYWSHCFTLFLKDRVASYFLQIGAPLFSAGLRAPGTSPASVLQPQKQSQALKAQLRLPLL